MRQNSCGKNEKGIAAMNVLKAAVEHIPVPVAGVALGLAALGNVLAGASALVHDICGILSALLVIALLAKIILAPKRFAEDMGNPVAASTCATLFMASMQLSVYLSALNRPAAFALWCTAIAGHFLLMAWFTKRFIFNFDLKNVHATYFIAYVGIIVASLTSPAFGMEAFGQLLFWFGFICYAVLFVIVTVRYARHEVAAPAKPTFCVYAAPMSLSLAGYLAVTPNPDLLLVAVMAIAAQALFVFVLVQVPKFIKGGFYPSFAAMTFPFVITATALDRAIYVLGQQGLILPDVFSWLVVAEIAFATCMVCFVFAHYLRFMGKNAIAAVKSAREEAAHAIEAAEALITGEATSR